MLLDDSLVTKYLAGQSQLQSHWIFDNIVEGEKTFESPEATEKKWNSEQKDLKTEVKKLQEVLVQELEDFKPYNKRYFDQLFPQWKQLLENVNIVLSVGCPDPYDAMTLSHEGKEYMVYDLIRFLSYQADPVSLIRTLLTHEFAHICIHADYKREENFTYKEQLSYIAFDEGLAHLLAFKEQVETYHFEEAMKEHFPKVSQMMTEALLETELEKQKEYLQKADCGAYWSKFAAIYGKLRMATQLEELKEIYDRGPERFL